MTSWRDTASASIQTDLDDLLNAVLPHAVDSLGTRGEFYPFGGSISNDDETRLAGGDPELGEHPPSDEVLSILYDGARASASTSRAAAFVADVRVDGSDAVRVELEHREGVALVVLLPYKRSRFKKSLSFGEMSVSLGQPRVWVA